MADFPQDISIKRNHLFGERKLRVSVVGDEKIDPESGLKIYEGDISIAALSKGSLMSMSLPRIPFTKMSEFGKALSELIKAEIPSLATTIGGKPLDGTISVHYGGGLTGLVTIHCSNLYLDSWLNDNATKVVKLLEARRDKIEDLYEEAYRNPEQFKRAQAAAKQAWETNPLIRRAAGSIDDLAQHLCEVLALGDDAQKHRDEAVLYMTAGKGNALVEAGDALPKPVVNAAGEVVIEPDEIVEVTKATSGANAVPDVRQKAPLNSRAADAIAAASLEFEAAEAKRNQGRNR